MGRLLQAETGAVGTNGGMPQGRVRGECAGLGTDVPGNCAGQWFLYLAVL